MLQGQSNEKGARRSLAELDEEIRGLLDQEKQRASETLDNLQGRLHGMSEYEQLSAER